MIVSAIVVIQTNLKFEITHGWVINFLLEVRIVIVEELKYEEDLKEWVVFFQACLFRGLQDSNLSRCEMNGFKSGTFPITEDDRAHAGQSLSHVVVSS